MRSTGNLLFAFVLGATVACSVGNSGTVSPLPGDPTCKVPAGVSTTPTDDGCYALVLTAGTNLPDGSFVTRELCAANQYGLSCESPSHENPSPDPTLGCAFPSGGGGYGADTQYCCPCAGDAGP